MNAFDLKSVLLAKHAQHVVLVHFPIALFLIGVAFDFIAQRTHSATLAAAAYYNLLVAAMSALPVVATGIMAWRWQLEGARLQGSLLLHFILGIVSSVFICTSWWIHYRTRRRADHPLPGYRMPLELAGVFVVALTGHLGGFLSGVN
ncbi:MAG TPA: DUF2231 domain-containing protein [Candidatus Angelobacter sp.]